MTIEARDTYGKGGKLERAVAVLELLATTESGETFVYPGGNEAPEDQSPRNDTIVKVNHELWEDLGSPRMVTVVLYPDNVIEEFPRHITPMLDKVTIFSSPKDDQFYIRGSGRNGEPLWLSEGYTQKKAARDHAYSYGVEVEEVASV